MALPIEDVIAIQQLMARYNHAIDGGDSATWADTFTEDGTFDLGGKVLKGREELVGFSDGFSGTVSNPRHFASNVLIEGDGDEARVRAYIHVTKTVGQPAETVIMTSGSYDDTVRRVDGEWRFAARRFTRDV